MSAQWIIKALIQWELENMAFILTHSHSQAYTHTQAFIHAHPHTV